MDWKKTTKVIDAAGVFDAKLNDHAAKYFRPGYRANSEESAVQAAAGILVAGLAVGAVMFLLPWVVYVLF